VTVELTFRDAVHRLDRRALSQFTCTQDPERCWSADAGWHYEHPREWEYDVRREIRGISIPSAQSPFALRVGYVGEELATVVYREEVDGPASVMCHLAAVALDFQGRGFGALLLVDALDTITSVAVQAGLHKVHISGVIFRENERSQRMCHAIGADRTGEDFPAGGEEWGYSLPV